MSNNFDYSSNYFNNNEETVENEETFDKDELLGRIYANVANKVLDEVKEVSLDCFTDDTPNLTVSYIRGIMDCFEIFTDILKEFSEETEEDYDD